MDTGEPHEESPPPEPHIQDFFWVGTAGVICVVGGGGVGYGLDSAFNTLPWLTFTGLALGVVFAVLTVVAQVRKFL